MLSKIKATGRPVACAGPGSLSGAPDKAQGATAEQPPHQPAPRLAAIDSAARAANSFCPRCFVMIDVDARHCPACGADLAGDRRDGFTDRLIHALDHPLADVRLRAIIALGLRAEKRAEAPLLACALRHPDDVVEGLEVVESLRRISRKEAASAALSALAERHKARAVRAAARRALRIRDASIFDRSPLGSGDEP
jgi:HEAT repeats